MAKKKTISEEKTQEEKELSTEFVEKKEKQKKPVKTDTTSVSVIDTQELNELINEDLGIKTDTSEEKKHYLLNTFLIIVTIISFIFLGLTVINHNSSIQMIISNLLLTIFTVIFTIVSITYQRTNKIMAFLGSLLLLLYFSLNITQYSQVFKTEVAAIPNFQRKEITSVMKWAEKNKITIHQEYEYSDMIEEYHVISQDITDKSLKSVKELTVSISEGANPSKEIILPNMVTWDSERVLKYVKDNHLSNVVVEFVMSDQAKDTVIEQNTSGTFRRNDELNLKFSYGEELGFEEVTLIDFKNKSKFEVEFYMKQHQLRYDFEEDFDSKIKKGFAVKQNIKAGETVKVDDERVVVTISKGPKVKVPDIKKMTIVEVTEWAIKNRLKINFTESYDDSVKVNGIIDANYQKGDIIEQGSVVKVTLSLGTLKMPKFKSLNDFYTWANSHQIRYEEKHEFSDKVKAGEVISYSHKTGDAIKNEDTIVVTISDGEMKKVPDLDGLTKSEAITKLDKADLNYTFIYKNSDKKKNIVIGQSIKAGSEISSKTTITVTLSNGKGEEKVEERRETTPSKPREDDDNHENDSTPSVPDTPEVTPTCNSCSFRASQIISTLQQYNTYESAASGLRSYLQSQCPGLKVNIVGVQRDGYDPGDFVEGFKGGNTDSCSTISITLAK